MNQTPPLILASSSPYRREQLERLGLSFLWEAPVLDETPQPGEAPATLVTRLAENKAAVVAARHPGSVVIGADQVAVLDGQIMGKPGNHVNAASQLSAASGKQVVFLTAVCLLDGQANNSSTRVDETKVQFRRLTMAEIENYLHAEKPYDCAGSFKAEGRGISLFEAIHTVDPTAIIGLPLISLCQLLRDAGFRL